MLILNKLPRAVSFAPDYDKKGASVAINKGLHKTVTLTPGINEVDDGLYSFIKGRKSFVFKLDNGDLEIKSAPGTDFKFEKLDIKAATKLIKETFDFDLLYTWQKAESRGQVLKLIDAQIDSLKVVRKK